MLCGRTLRALPFVRLRTYVTRYSELRHVRYNPDHCATCHPDGTHGSVPVFLSPSLSSVRVLELVVNPSIPVHLCLPSPSMVSHPPNVVCAFRRHSGPIDLGPGLKQTCRLEATAPTLSSPESPLAPHPPHTVPKRTSFSCDEHPRGQRRVPGDRFVPPTTAGPIPSSAPYAALCRRAAMRLLARCGRPAAFAPP